MGRVPDGLATGSLTEIEYGRREPLDKTKVCPKNVRR
jgi:hypothetical protein